MGVQKSTNSRARKRELPSTQILRVHVRECHVEFGATQAVLSKGTDFRVLLWVINVNADLFRPLFFPLFGPNLRSNLGFHGFEYHFWFIFGYHFALAFRTINFFVASPRTGPKITFKMEIKKYPK